MPISIYHSPSSMYNLSTTPSSSDLSSMQSPTAPPSECPYDAERTSHTIHVYHLAIQFPHGATSIVGIVLIVLKLRRVHGGNIHVRRSMFVLDPLSQDLPNSARPAISMPTLLNPAATRHNNSSIHSIHQLLGGLPSGVCKALWSAE